MSNGVQLLFDFNNSRLENPAAFRVPHPEPRDALIILLVNDDTKRELVQETTARIEASEERTEKQHSNTPINSIQGGGIGACGMQDAGKHQAWISVPFGRLPSFICLPSSLCLVVIENNCSSRTSVY